MDYKFYSQDYIYEPLKEYDLILREMHDHNVKKYFESLTTKSNVNIEQN